MKKVILAATAVLSIIPAAQAQSAIDMLQVSQPGFRGTARFMGMGGAFTALGADLSTMTQNPAGIGMYRHSDIGVTVDLSFQGTKSPNGQGGWNKENKTKFDCNNFGYAGVASLGEDSAMPFFTWGVSYNRLSSFDRVYNAYAPSTQTSLTNYIASFSNGMPANDLNFGTDYNPYKDSDLDWLSILAYNSFLMNEQPGSTDTYAGLYQNGTVGDAKLDVHEKGYIDEYNIDFGGNVMDMLYWGVGIGITDLSYRRDVTYSESMENARIYDSLSGSNTTNGNAGFYLDNYKRITGSGWKLSAGLIFKPIDELRIGAAIHTPTWWSLDEEYDAAVDYSYYNPVRNETNANRETTDWASFSWRLKSPWKFMVGIAGVIGQNAIISVDYERQAYNDMTCKNAVYDSYGYESDYRENHAVNADVKQYCKGADIIRVGAEFRVTPQFSIRAGYNYTSSWIKKDARDNYDQIVTAGTDPSYSFTKDMSNISFGIGYKFNNFYVDGTYVHDMRTSDLAAYTSFDGNESPRWQVKDNNNSVVVTLGYRF